MNFGISIGDILKLCELAGRVYKNCRDCTGEYKSLTSEARSLTNLLEDIQDKFDKIPENKHRQLHDAYEPCIEVLQDLDKLLTHYNSLDTKSKRAWDRLKWDPDKSRTLRSRLSSSVAMLNAFYTSMIHDSQVLILEALGRLELDYKGGHREESIASLERITSASVDDDEDDDAAWTQILRDLEDVGVAKQDALGYRDMIVDWLVAAVNEGRLLEQRPESDSLSTMPQDMSVDLPATSVTDVDTHVDIPGRHHLDVPEIFPVIQRSQSAVFSPPSPLIAPDPMEGHRARSIPSAASLPAAEPSGRSSCAASQSSETDASSLYAWPQPLSIPPKASTSSFDTRQIKRVPLPAPVVAQTTNISPSSSVVTDEATSWAVPLAPSRSAPPIPLDIYNDSVSAPQVYHATTETPASAPEVCPPITKGPESAPQVIETPQPPAPPSYYDKKETVTADVAWTAQQIMAAWSRRDFPMAERCLEEQLAAVERGQTVIATGQQPDRRILRHLIGVCASYTGNFTKAKKCFESVFNGIYLHRSKLDDGDIAAAWWLGDACMHLREHQNALLAWSVVFEGCIGRYGISRDHTLRAANELRLIDRWLSAFPRVENAFQNNVDPTNIFRQTHSIEKNNLIVTVKMQLQDADTVRNNQYGTTFQYGRPVYTVGPRPKTELISEGFLLAPLISLSAWPMPWDHTFSPMDSVQLDRSMNTIRTMKFVAPLVERNLPTASLGASKDLHFVTKRGNQWLIETVKKALQDMCIEHAEHASEPIIICCLNQHRDGYAFSEGVEIIFKKLQFRSVYGLRIGNVKWATRLVGEKGRDTKDFREILKASLEDAERAAATGQAPGSSMASSYQYDKYR